MTELDTDLGCRAPCRSMQVGGSPSGPRRGSKIASSVSLGALLTLIAACSLGNVHHDDCTTDTQCVTSFGTGSKCASGFCTTPDAPGCQKKGPDGRACFSCVPQVTTDFESACTNAACAPFDNHARLTKLGADGSLPTLP